MKTTLSIEVPRDTKFSVDADSDWVGRFFAQSSDSVQAEIFAAFVRYMSSCPIQWDYVAIEISKLPNAREIQNILTMLGTPIHD